MAIEEEKRKSGGHGVPGVLCTCETSFDQR